MIIQLFILTSPPLQPYTSTDFGTFSASPQAEAKELMNGAEAAETMNEDFDSFSGINIEEAVENADFDSFTEEQIEAAMKSVKKCS